MRVLNPAFRPSFFFARVARAARSVLLLDYDGTLAPFACDRVRAEPYPGVREGLARIAADRRTRLAIVSGRPLNELAALLGLPLELWGSHGLEHRLEGGRREAAPTSAEAARLVADVSRWIGERGWGRLLEEKPFGFALHARAFPDVFAQAAPAVLARWAGPARSAGLDLRVFDAGVEFRPAGRGKGDVVERVLSEEDPGIPVAFLGDDETDEDGFARVRGRGLGVLVRNSGRETRADVLLRPPSELLAFLRVWREPSSSVAP